MVTDTARAIMAGPLIFFKGCSPSCSGGFVCRAAGIQKIDGSAGVLSAGGPSRRLTGADAVPNSGNGREGDATGVARRVRGAADIGLRQRTGLDPVALPFHGSTPVVRLCIELGPARMVTFSNVPPVRKCPHHRCECLRHRRREPYLRSP